MNIFEENKMNSIETGRIKIESGTLFNDKGEEIATCTGGYASPPKSLNVRLVRAKTNGTWAGNYIPAGTITKINYDIPSRHSWYLLVGGAFVPFYKNELEKYFEPIND